MSKINVPYTKKKERKLVQGEHSMFSKPAHEMKLYLAGPGESGKSSLFKQIVLANGLFFSKEERATLRYHLIKTVFYGLKGVIQYIQENEPTTLLDLQTHVDVVLNFSKRNILPDQDLRQAQLTTTPMNVKRSVVALWSSPNFKRNFRGAVQCGQYNIIESCRLICDQLVENKKVLADFGTKKYDPDPYLCLLSNGTKYPQAQKLFFQVEANSHRKFQTLIGDQAEAAYFARPDVRPFVLKAPLKHPTIKWTKSSPYWKITVSEPKRQFPTHLREKDCLVFTADISGYDTIAGPAHGVKDPVAMQSVMMKGFQEFDQFVNKGGHLIALVFTHLDVFYKKYQKERIPLNIHGEFPDAPVVEDEDDDAITLGLRYFREKFAAKRMEILNAMEGTSGAERKKELFRVFCIDGTDPENVQGTLRALLEQYFGLNVPINNKALE